CHIDLIPSAEETEPFKTDEFAATPTPPPTYRTTSRMSFKSPAPISFPSKAEVARLFALPTPPSSPLTPLSSDIPEADIPPWKRLLHLGLRLGRALLLLLDSRDLLWPVGSIIVLWILWMPVSELQRGGLWDNAALRGEADTLRRYLSSLCTTHKQERVEARQALARSEAHNRALETRIVVLETQAYHHEWQRQDEDDHAYWKHHAYPSTGG
ncbi:hypothetical protein Tco_1100662, partial [Tanacetum coccineum]